MSEKKSGISLLRDWKYALAALLALFAVSYGVNFVNAVSDISETRAELQAEGLEAAAAELPTYSEQALKTSTGSLYSLAQLFNIVAIVAAGSLIGFHLLKYGFPNTLGKLGDEFNEGWDDMEPRERTRWQILAWILILVCIVGGRADGATQLSLPISEKATDTIIYYEVGGKSYFERNLSKPTVPAWQSTASGVTVGFGVDCGHMTRSQIRDAFEGILPESQIIALQSVSGMKGRNAYYNGLPKVRNTVRVTWDQAVEVFNRNTLPRFTKLTKDAFNLDPDRLHPHENGALVSLVFNRGPSMSSSSSRREMRAIRYDIGRGYAGYVPGHIRSMKRLWSYTKLRGLHLRRDAEADLFALGSRIRISR